MDEPRIASAVSDTWGRGTVYTYEPLPAVETKISSVGMLPKILSTITEDIPEVKEPEPELLVLIEGYPYLFTCLFASVFEDVIAQIWILERCNNELAIIKTLSDMDHFKAVKYGVVDPNEVKDELDGIDHRNLNNIIYKIKKLDSDRKLVTSVMFTTYTALAKSFSYHPLVRYNNAIEDRDRYRAELAEEENKNKLLRRELSKQVRQQRNHIKTVLYDTDVMIDKLRTQVEDSILYTEVRGRYIDNWQLARTEQHTQKIYDTEHAPASSIEFYKERSDHELRVHSEVETLVGIAINETLAKVEDWMDKYDKDMEQIDLQIQIKKNDYQNMRDKRVALEEKIERHDKRMKDWISFKDGREKLRAYREKMTTSAIIVQAWWRGLLVRLELGPFRPKRTKKDLAKKKK